MDIIEKELEMLDMKKQKKRKILLIKSALAKELFQALRKGSNAETLRTLNKAIGRSTGGVKPQRVKKQTMHLVMRETENKRGAAPSSPTFKLAMLALAKPILQKAAAAGELDIAECSRAETQLNRAVHDPLSRVDQKFIDLLSGKSAVLRKCFTASNARYSLMAKAAKPPRIRERNLPPLAVLQKARPVLAKALLQKAKPALARAVRSGELDAFEAGKIETALNKSVNTGCPVNEEYLRLIARQMKQPTLAFAGVL